MGWLKEPELYGRFTITRHGAEKLLIEVSRKRRRESRRSGTRKELVQTIMHQACLKQTQVYQLLRVMDIEKQVLDKFQVPENPQPDN